MGSNTFLGPPPRPHTLIDILCCMYVFSTLRRAVLLAEMEGEITLPTAASLPGGQAAAAHLFLPTGQHSDNSFRFEPFFFLKNRLQIPPFFFRFLYIR